MWKWKNKKLEKIPKNKFGFVYIIIDKTNDNFYIGKKQFYSITNVKLSKKKQNINYKGIGRKKQKEEVIKETNWRNYKSSSKQVISLIESKDIKNFEFKILEFAENSTQLKYLETFYQFKYDIFRNKLSLNEQIIYRANIKSVKW